MQKVIMMPFYKCKEGGGGGGINMEYCLCFLIFCVFYLYFFLFLGGIYCTFDFEAAHVYRPCL